MDQHSKQDHIAEEAFSEGLERFLTSVLHRWMLLALCTALVVSAPTWAYGFQDGPVMINTPGDGFLALRSEPTTKSGRRLAKIPHGTQIWLGECRSASNGAHWCQTTFQGFTGWVLDRYVVSIESFPTNRATPEAAPGRDRPVMVGGDPDFGACGALGVVRGLDPHGDGFLALRSGPSAKTRLIDQLREGDAVYFCESVPGWIGVVVYPPNPLIDCGVSEVLMPRQPYSGPCKTGWVSEKWIEIVAP